MENGNIINPKVLEWFESRGISQKTIALMGIYSGRHWPDGDGFRVDPDPGGNIIVFPYTRQGRLVNAKYRAAGKKFYQLPGGTPCLWNSDVLTDPDLTEGHKELVIVEGEMDALSVLQAGYPYVVSVPNGAPPPKPAGVDAGEIDPEHDEKFSYVMLDWDRLKRVKRIIIASDGDGPGRQLAEELVRRLGRVRCSYVTYPDDCKDFNEVLLKEGVSAITAIIAKATPYPVSGIYTLRQLPVEPELEAVSTGWGRVDDYMRPFYPSFMVVTGPANHGKSTWTNQFVAQLAYKHGWKAAIASFEMRIKPFVTDTLASVKRERSPGADELEVEEWVNRNFVFLAPEPEEDDTCDIDWILEKAAAAVIRHGIRILVIDPWNEVEQAIRRKELHTDYVGRALRDLKRFGRKFECMVIVVAHPNKNGAQKPPDQISLYDVADCYSSDTEVLTRRGWLAFPQVMLADEVSCFDLKTGRLVWHEPSKVIRQPYRGKMARFKGRSFDLLVTPNHRMVVRPRWRDPIGTQVVDGIGRPTRWLKDQWQFSRPDDLPSAPFWMPVAPGMEDGDEPGVIQLDRGYNADDFVDLIGWYLAEGHQASVSVAISQAKQPYTNEIRALMQRMGLDVREQVSSAVGIHPLATMNTISFYIRKRRTPKIVEWLREHCGSHSDTKKIPEAIYDLSPRLKRRLIEAFLRGDGKYIEPGVRREAAAVGATTSPYLRDGLQRLAVESKISCSIGPKVQVQLHHKPSWALNFTFGRTEVGLNAKSHLSWEEYDGDVHCLTVPTGAFMIRRNGRPVVSGNSAHFANKADFGVVIARVTDDAGNLTTLSNIMIKKIRYQPVSGQPGTVQLTYDPNTRTFGQ